MNRTSNALTRPRKSRTNGRLTGSLLAAVGLMAAMLGALPTHPAAAAVPGPESSGVSRIWCTPWEWAGTTNPTGYRTPSGSFQQGGGTKEEVIRVRDCVYRNTSTHRIAGAVEFHGPGGGVQFADYVMSLWVTDCTLSTGTDFQTPEYHSPRASGSPFSHESTGETYTNVPASATSPLIFLSGTTVATPGHSYRLGGYVGGNVKSGAWYNLRPHYTMTSPTYWQRSSCFTA